MGAGSSLEQPIVLLQGTTACCVALLNKISGSHLREDFFFKLQRSSCYVTKINAIHRIYFKLPQYSMHSISMISSMHKCWQNFAIGFKCNTLCMVSRCIINVIHHLQCVWQTTIAKELGTEQDYTEQLLQIFHT